MDQANPTPAPAVKSAEPPPHVMLLGDYLHRRAGTVLKADAALITELKAAKVEHRAATAAEIEIAFQQ